MNKNGLYTILFSVLMAFLFMPMIQEHYDMFKTKPLKGVTLTTEFPKFSMDSYSQCKYQSQLEKYISENFGFREFVIRLYNQYLWSCYRKTYCHFIIPGKDNWVYYAEAVNEYYGKEQLKWHKTHERAKDWYEKNVEMMCQLRAVLQSYGIEFLSFMAPSKAYIYPEYLPEGNRDTTMFNTIEYYDRLLTEANFPHIEMTKWFKTMKDTLPYPIFPTMDNHWQFTSVYAYDSLFRFMDNLKHFGIPKIKYGEPQAYDLKFQSDEATLNLLFPVRDKSTDYKLDVEIECDDSCRKPQVLFVGDSFIWALNEQLPWEKLMEDIEIWFYNSDVYKGFDRKPYKKDDINMLRDMLKADYIVFYTSGHLWHRATYDFVEQALLTLCVSDSLMEVESIRIADSLGISKEEAIAKIKDYPGMIRGIMNCDNPSIRNEKEIRIAQTINMIEDNEEWVTALNIQATTQNKNIEEIYRIEAENVINNRPLLRSSTKITEEKIIEAKVNDLIRGWRLNKDMMEFLREKSKQKNKDLEVVILEDARWVVKQELKKQKQ